MQESMKIDPLVKKDLQPDQHQDNIQKSDKTILINPLNQETQGEKMSSLTSKHREIKKGVHVDPFDVIRCFKVSCPVQASMTEKLLMLSSLPQNQQKEALVEFAELIERALEMHDESVSIGS